MIIKDLNFAISICNQGKLSFNKGKATRAFLFENKWYPLRATVNFARKQANKKKITTDRCLVELAYLIPYIRISDQKFYSEFPLEVDINQKLNEIKHISKLLAIIVTQEEV